MKKLLVISAVIIAACGGDDPEPKYPVPSGCVVIAIRCNTGDESGSTDEDPDQVCKDHGGFKEWVCKP